jgi:curved DNA-binding protein CbpA
MKTLYELLGVSPDASDEALTKAYRKLAKMRHPDLNPNDPDAARRFREVTVAIAILRDAKRRSAYNQRLVRELQRRLDREREWRHREREWRRLQWPRIAAISIFAAVLIGIVVTNGSAWVEPVSSTSFVDSGTTYDGLQQPFRVSTAQRESVSRDRSSDLPAAAPPPQTSTNGQSEASSQPAQHCGHETEPHCELPKRLEADERGLSANEKAALIREAQELLASGDAKNAGVLLQRACQNSKSRCDLGLLEYR